ncbi:MAG: hypothetical protein H8E47_03935 [Anaerolineales bacterium]|nr:hypothetical protein [Anaerolineales bacterium]
MSQKNIVPLNDPRGSFDLFEEKLVPTVVDARGGRVEVDLGDYLHGVLDHPEMPSRINWIVETLQNPAEIRRHWDKRLPFREVYVNTIYQSEEDLEGEMHIVVVDRKWGRLRFWTTFVPKDRERYSKLVRRGKLLWKAKN